MRILSFAAENFRNLTSVRFEPHSRFNVIEGRNGQGKTNILEAIYLLAHLKSFREAKTVDLVKFGLERAQVMAEIEQSGVTRRLSLKTENKGKRVHLDGKPIEKMSTVLGLMNVVFFGPDDLVLTKGSPKHRRIFMDRAVSNLWPAYADEARLFSKSLKMRNSLLRQAKEKQLDKTVMEAFDEQYLLHATKVIFWRRKFVQSFIPFFKSSLLDMTNGDLEGSLHYAWLECEEDEASIKAMLREQLEKSWVRDSALGYTTQGPQADDITCVLNGHPLRRVASQGQHRAFVLAMRIAQMEQVKKEQGFYPILLLDDVSSELDEERNKNLMSYLNESGGQVFITTTDRSWTQVQGETQFYRVQSGAIT
jgi:DNA replication and repair protein RecF